MTYTDCQFVFKENVKDILVLFTYAARCLSKNVKCSKQFPTYKCDYVSHHKLN